jgi:hypothetical protein
VRAQTMRSKVVGVTFENADGSDRQSIIRKHCRPGVPLEVRPEPNNPADENALSLWVQRGGLFASGSVQIGYVRAELAEQLQELLEDGCTISGHILEVTGGGRKNYGANIELRVENAVEAHSGLGLLWAGLANVARGLAGILVALVGIILSLGSVTLRFAKNRWNTLLTLSPSRRIALAGLYAAISGVVLWGIGYVLGSRWPSFYLLRPLGFVTLTAGLGVFSLGAIYSWSEPLGQGNE